ncbi:MAG: hypothetical protein ACD_49C00086G0005 [uncultured bacterium (gcode 4)]|uniref:HicB-like antitoxin of toxin-antitoxin system domain-containing protein n=1 Tax=uncultured bacterium (gcode 4) TaxID=1234023 RepID=K2BU85_9BACT|nr:MAG: hypothetical protein ACD_49C00086G0005 [uncultured bacterium (gcode 4)]
MLDKILDYYLQNAIYEKDESGYILASVPWESGFFSQWENYEQARNNLKDAIEWVITIRLLEQDKNITSRLKTILSYKEMVNA